LYLGPVGLFVFGRVVVGLVEPFPGGLYLGPVGLFVLGRVVVGLVEPFPGGLYLGPEGLVVDGLVVDGLVVDGLVVDGLVVDGLVVDGLVEPFPGGLYLGPVGLFVLGRLVDPLLRFGRLVEGLVVVVDPPLFLLDEEDDADDPFPLRSRLRLCASDSSLVKIITANNAMAATKRFDLNIISLLSLSLLCLGIHSIFLF
jgi:hypothetical protein